LLSNRLAKEDKIRLHLDIGDFSIFHVQDARLNFGAIEGVRTHDAILPALRNAVWAVRYDKVIVGNALVECDLGNKKIWSVSIWTVEQTGDQREHRHQGLSWVAPPYARARQGMRASAGWLVRATLGTSHGDKRAHADNALSARRIRLLPTIRKK
jgi:hypothetical protein